MRPVRELMRDRRVAAALAAAAVLAVGYRVLTSGGNGSGGSAPPAGAPVENAASAPAVANSQHSTAPGPAAAEPAPPAAGRAKTTAAWSWGRNPFIPGWRETAAGAAAGDSAHPTAATPKEPLSDLRGTVTGGRRGIAIFGDRLVPAGEKVGEWTVERVEAYGVTVRRGDEVRVVEMFKPAP